MNLLGFFSPGQKKVALWVKILIGVNIVYYMASLYVSHILPVSANMEFFSPSGPGLLVMGASGRELLVRFHMFHSLINANFLHANLMHIAFNMVAFYQLFRPVCWSYGTDRGLVIYLVSGVFAYICSAVVGIEFTVGASGAVFGLMGALLYFAKSRGDLFGQRLFKEIAIWAALVLVIGFFAEGVNNVAHLTGLIAGGFLGWLLGYKTRESRKIVLIANIILIITVLCLLYPIALFW